MAGIFLACLGDEETIELSKNPRNAFLRRFDLFIEDTAPPVVTDTISSSIDGDVEIKKIRFRSVLSADRVNEVFSYLIYPREKTDLPAMLILHGGTQTADDHYELGLLYARRGYACLIPDLPGIASPQSVKRNGTGSSGSWTEYPYGARHFSVNPDITASSIYEAVATAIQAFYLLRSQAFVDSAAIGIRGLSWGGYASIVTTALLGDKVRAGLSVYGSGFYEISSAFMGELNNMDNASRSTWLSQLDAGRYAGKITVPFYFLSASNDTFFHPPSVMATFDEMRGEKHVVFSPNDDHNLTGIESPGTTEFTFFNYHMKKQGGPIEKIVIESITLMGNDYFRQITFSVVGPSPVTNATVWHSTDGHWPTREWTGVVASSISPNRYRATIPSVTNWYIVATDERRVSSGTGIY